MCYAAAIPYVIEAVVAVAGAAYGANAAKQAAQYNDQVAQNQAKLDNIKAQNANAIGSYEADQARIRGNLMRGQQIATFAANNVDVTTGSASDILGDTAMFTASDERQARINAAQQAYGFQVDAANAQAAGKYALWQGNEQATSSWISGLGSAAGSVAGGIRAGSFGGGAGSSLTGSTVLTGGYGDNGGNLGLWSGYG